MTYHEKLAQAMMRTYTVSSMNTYETVLAALQKKSESELRAMVAKLEEQMSLRLGMPNSFHLVKE